MSNADEAGNLPENQSALRQFWAAFIKILTSFAAAGVATWTLASLSATWVYLGRNPGVPLWFLLVVAATILFAHFALYYLHAAFAEFHGSHRITVHVVLIGVLFLAVAVPVAMLQSLTRARLHLSDAQHNAEVNSLKAERDKLSKELKDMRDAQAAREGERLELYSQVTGTLTKTLQQPNLDPANLTDLLHFCVESIALNKPPAQQHTLRSAVVYLDSTRKYLVVPPNGYYGYALDQKIRRLYFTVSPKSDDEKIEDYRRRLGVAGWSYVEKSAVHDADVLVIKPGKLWRYKYGDAPEEQIDHAMICVPIPDLTDADGQRYIGVLSVSSTMPGALTEGDLAVANFFATLLGRFRTPAETPPWLMTASRAK